MKLTIEQIKDIAKGVARVEESDERIALLRFTKEQEVAYEARNDDFYKKTFASIVMR